MSTERRVGAHQREEDLGRDVALWAFWLTKRRGRVILAFSVISSVVTFLMTTAAMRIVDPRKEIKPLQDSVVALSRVVAETKNGLALATVDRIEIKEDLRWVRFMLCEDRRDRHPGRFLPPVCAKP